MNALLADEPLQSEETLLEILYYFNFNSKDYRAYFNRKVKM